MKPITFILLFVIPATSFGIDPDVIQYPASEYRREVPRSSEDAKPAPWGEGNQQLSFEEKELQIQAREDRPPLESADDSQTAPRQSHYVTAPFEDPQHMKGTRMPLDFSPTNQDLGRGLPSHAQPPRGLTPPEQRGQYGLPAD